GATIYECPWPTCQKAPGVALTQGWGRNDLLADLGNNAAFRYFIYEWTIYMATYLCSTQAKKYTALDQTTGYP
ncbi:hypothetical protein ACE1BS_22045, partial [Aeromonas jandaei]